jgi:hypothetical protein
MEWVMQAENNGANMMVTLRVAGKMVCINATWLLNYAVLNRVHTTPQASALITNH